VRIEYAQGVGAAVVLAVSKQIRVTEFATLFATLSLSKSAPSDDYGLRPYLRGEQ
jgi:hypothetical protein